MIVSHIKGGIGNQLFQYALGRTLAENANEELYLDNSLFTSGKSWNRAFRLDKFGFKYKVASKEDIQKFQEVKSVGVLQKALQSLNILKKFEIISEDASQINLSLKQKRGNLYLKGYWQSEIYFKEIREILIKEWVPSFELSMNAKQYLKLINDTNAVCVHFRRGDYVSVESIQKSFGILPIKYYQQAIHNLSNSISNIELFIFSDDIPWVKSNFHSDLPTHFIDNINLDYEELYLMSCCKHNIIANSSFSWWGAWLNNHSEKQVFAPQPWFINYAADMSGMVPNGWNKINYLQS